MADPASVPEDPPVAEVASFGNWRAVISRTSGKTYYYNVKTDISQWKKPDKWVIHDARLAEKRKEETMALQSEQEQPPPDV